jgi:hypothetical protein
MPDLIANFTPFAPAHDDQKKIMDDGTWVPCRICEEIFLRIRLIPCIHRRVTEGRRGYC